MNGIITQRDTGTQKERIHAHGHGYSFMHMNYCMRLFSNAEWHGKSKGRGIPQTEIQTSVLSLDVEKVLVSLFLSFLICKVGRVITPTSMTC